MNDAVWIVLVLLLVLGGPSVIYWLIGKLFLSKEIRKSPTLTKEEKDSRMPRQAWLKIVFVYAIIVGAVGWIMLLGGVFLWAVQIWEWFHGGPARGSELLIWPLGGATAFIFSLLVIDYCERTDKEETRSEE